MNSFIISKLIFGLAGALISSAILYGFYDYIELKSSFSKSQKTITLIRERNKNISTIMNRVENEKEKNWQSRQRYLLQIERDGYISSANYIFTDRLRKKQSDDNRP
jgi:hypothetical protein